MFLHRIHLNPRCKEARRDVADPYQMHATLCRAFFPQETKCPPGSLLWRLEPETDCEGRARVLIQSHNKPDWSQLHFSDWLARAEPGIDLVHKLGLDGIELGQQYRYRIRANPCRKIKGKRRALMQMEDQQEWLKRKGEQHGFLLPQSETVDYFAFLQSSPSQAYINGKVSHQQMLMGRQHDGNEIRVNAVLFEGQLGVSDPEKFRMAVQKGIGHGKVMGLGLLSLIPV